MAGREHEVTKALFEGPEQREYETIGMKLENNK
jgi:hypothetical protein